MHIAIATVVILAGILAWTISLSNRLKVILVKIKEADAGIDAALTNRYDTLAKLMDVVRIYAQQEINTLSDTVSLGPVMNISQKVELSHRLDIVTGKVNILAESYPELRSSENYRRLQDAILDAEDLFDAAWRVYNTRASSFNQLIVQFPANLIAHLSKYSRIIFFEAEGGKSAGLHYKNGNKGE